MKKRPPASEQNILDELRALTEATRKVRQELQGMVDTPKPHDLTRSLLHTQSWPKERQRAESPVPKSRRRPKR